MKTNLTIKLDRDLVKKARILAAERDTSVSGLVAEQLEKAVHDREAYDVAKQHALARMKKGFNLSYKRPASRDEFHER